MSELHHVVLVPGFFGFLNLGELTYFSRVCEQLTVRLEQLGIRADVRGAVNAMPERDRRACDQLLRETVSEAARQLRTPRATLEYAVDRIRTQMRKAEIHEYLS